MLANGLATFRYISVIPWTVLNLSKDVLTEMKKVGSSYAHLPSATDQDRGSGSGYFEI